MRSSSSSSFGRSSSSSSSSSCLGHGLGRSSSSSSSEAESIPMRSATLSVRAGAVATSPSAGVSDGTGTGKACRPACRLLSSAALSALGSRVADTNSEWPLSSTKVRLEQRRSACSGGSPRSTSWSNVLPRRARIDVQPAYASASIPASTPAAFKSSAVLASMRGAVAPRLVRTVTACTGVMPLHSRSSL